MNPLFTYMRAFAAIGAWPDSLVAVPLWLVGLFWALIVTAVGALLIVMIRRRRRLEVEVPTITKAEIFGLRWRWNYHEGAICGVTCHCPKCEGEVKARSETRHGFLHLISYACECRKWRSKSFQCSQEQMMQRVCQAIQEQTALQPVATNHRRCAAG